MRRRIGDRTADAEADEREKDTTINAIRYMQDNAAKGNRPWGGDKIRSVTGDRAE